MAQQTAADDGFDFEAYREQLVESGLELFGQLYVDMGYDAHNALTEVATELADEEVGYNSVSHSLAILEESPNEPDEWNQFAEGKDDWREVIRVMAYTVVRQDVYDALEAEGYLDDHWNPTDKLVEDTDE